MADQETVIEVQQVTRVFRSPKKASGFGGWLRMLARPEFTEHTALDSVSFKIQAGEFIGLIGANGAGKTTLLKILSGLIPPTTGSAQVRGFEPFQRAIDFRRQIALVMGQKAQLWWDLPAIDAFDLLRAIYAIPPDTYKHRLAVLTELLDVGRHLHTQIRRLSLGERMKMELIGALLHWPRVIFLDEPTIGLDVLAAHKLREFLRQFNQQEKVTIILTSHNMEDIERLCPRVLILRSGKMIYDGSPSRLTSNDERRLRVRFLETPSIEELQTVLHLPPEAITSETEGDSDSKIYYITSSRLGMAGVLQMLMQRYQIADMGIEEQTLEKVIQRLYERPE